MDAALGQSLQSKEAALAKLPPDLVALLELKGYAKDALISGKELPVELLNMVRAHLYDESFLPMTEEEAKGRRAELLKERIEHHIRVDLGWSDYRYFLFRN